MIQERARERKDQHAIIACPTNLYMHTVCSALHTSVLSSYYFTMYMCVCVNAVIILEIVLSIRIQYILYSNPVPCIPFIYNSMAMGVHSQCDGLLLDLHHTKVNIHARYRLTPGSCDDGFPTDVCFFCYPSLSSPCLLSPSTSILCLAMRWVWLIPLT